MALFLKVYKPHNEIKIQDPLIIYLIISYIISIRHYQIFVSYTLSHF